MASAPGMVLVVIGIAVMAVTASEAKMRRRSIELPDQLHLSSKDIALVKRASSFAAARKEPELIRMKRFKRDAPEEELQRVKRAKRDASDGGGLERVKRTKRTAEDQDPVLELVQRSDDTVGDRQMIHHKKFKRSVRLNKFSNKEAFRMKRAGKNKKVSGPLYDFPTVKRSKRGGLVKSVDSMKHAKNTHTHPHLRDKRRQPLNMETAHQSKMDDVVKKAVEKMKRFKRHPKHTGGKSAKLHRTKRGGLKEHRSEVLKDITRDITRLQRLRRGLTHEVIRDSKRQSHARNHNIVKRHDAPKSNRLGTKKIHKASP